MTNLNLRIFGSANLKQVQSEFAKLHGQIIAINSEMAKQVNPLGTVDPTGFANANRQLQRSSLLYRQALASTGMFHVEQLRLNSATHTYTELLQKQKLGLRDAIKQREILKRVYKEQLAMENMVVRTHMDTFRGKQVLDVSFPTEVNKSLDTARARLGMLGTVAQSVGTQMVNFGKNTQWAGRQLMVGFTMPVAAAVAGMSVLAYQADQQLTRIAKVYDTYAQDQAGKERELNMLRTQSLGMAAQAAEKYGASLQNTLMVEAELAATGKQGSELRDSTMEVVRVATLGELEYADAISTTIALQSAFKMSTGELTDTFNFMNAVENATSLSLKDITEATPRAAAAMAGMNVSAKEMTVLLTAMKERGVDAAEGANALKSATTRILKPTRQASEYFMEFGINLNEITKASGGNLFEFLKQLGSVTSDMDNLSKQKGIAMLFGTYQYNRLNAALAGVSDAFGENRDEAAQTTKAVDLLSKSTSDLAANAEAELERLRESVSNRFQRALQSLKVELAEMGMPFLEFASKGLEIITSLVKAFNSLPGPIKAVMAGLAIGAAITGPLIMLTGLFFNLLGNTIKMGASLLTLAGNFGLVSKEQRAAALAAKLAEKGFQSETLAIQNLTAEVKKYAMAQAEAHRAQLMPAGNRGGPVTLAAGVGANPAAQGTMTAGGLWIPASHTAAAQKLNAEAAEEAAKASEKQNRAMQGAAVSGGILAGALAASAISSNETVDKMAEMAMLAAIVGPALVAAATALKAVPWATMAVALKGKALSGFGAAVGQSKALSTNWKAAGGAIGKTGFLIGGVGRGIMALLGPVGLFVAAVTAGAVAWAYLSKKAGEAAENVRKMTQNSEALGKIVGFEPKQADALDATSTKASEVQKRVAAMNDEFTLVVDKIRDATTEQDKFNTAMSFIGTKVISEGGTIEQAKEAVRLALRAAGKTAEEADAIVIRFQGEFDKEGMQRSAMKAAETFSKNAQDALTKMNWFEGLRSGDSFSNESEQWGKDAGEKIVLGIRTAMDQGLGQGQTMVSMDKLFGQLEARSAEMAAIQKKRVQEGQGVDVMLKKEQEATQALIGTMKRKIIEDLAGKKTADQYTDAQLELMTSSQLLHISNIELSRSDYDKRNAAYLSAAATKNAAGETLTLAEAQALSAKTARDNIAKMDGQTGAIKKVSPAAREAKNDLQALIATFASAEEGWKATANAVQEGTKAAMQEYADQAQSNFQSRMDAAMDAYKANQEKRMDALKGLHEAAEKALERSQDRAMDRLDRQQDAQMDRLEARQKAAQDRLEAQQDSQEKTLEKRQDARRKMVEAMFDARIDKINAAIEAEERAEELRQRIFEAEKTRIQRLAEMANRSIDFNAALNAGELDEAAKIMNDASAAESEWALSDAADASGMASDARKSALQKQIDNIEKLKQSRLDALKITEDAEKAALAASQKRQTDALAATQKREKDALAFSLKAQKDALAIRFQNERDNLAARQKIETDAMNARINANIKAEQKIWDGRKAQLDRAIKDFQNFAPKNAAELQKHITDIGARYDQFRVTTRGKFNGTAADVRSTLSRNIHLAMQELAANQKWEAIGRTISSQMVKGAFNMNMDQFIKWVTTGATPKNWTANKIKPLGFGPTKTAPLGHTPAHHGGGEIGGGGTGRAGLSGSLHRDERYILAQDGEFMMRKKAVKHYGPGFMQKVNDLGFGSKNEGKGGGDLGFAGMLGAGLAQGGMAALASGIASAGARAMARDMAATGFMAGKPGKYGGVNFTAEQLANAAIIASVGSSMGMSVRDIQIGIMTAITESMLRNIPGGDRDSVGLFQQRPSQGWGSVSQIMNPTYAARKFFEALKQSKGHDAMPPWLAAQSVQRSFDSSGSNYRQYWDEAMAIFSAFTRGESGLIQDDGSYAGIANRTGKNAIAWAAARIGDAGWMALCQKFVRMSLGAGPGFPSAITAWQGAKYRHGIRNTASVPPGVPVYWSGGKYGHVALSTGGGGIISTDFPNMGYVGRGTINSLSTRWGKSLLGWTEDINGKRIWGPGMADGGFTLSDGLAKLHQNEVVLSAPLTSDFKKGVQNFAEGGGDTYNINVDARGAEYGMEDRIVKKAITEIKRLEARKPQSRKVT